jgi:hypothetical protein
MKVYRVIDGIIHRGEAHDGAMHLEIGATGYAVENGDGHQPIEMIDNGKRIYRRSGNVNLDFPARFYLNSDVRWERDS